MTTAHSAHEECAPLDQLETIASLVRRHAPNDGMTPAPVPGATLIRSSSPTAIQRGMLRPSVCVVAQGRKDLYLGTEVIPYSAGCYLASSIDMPVAGQVVGASRARPYLAVAFDVTPREVGSVLGEAKLNLERASRPSAAAAFIGRVDAKLLDVVSRLLRSFDDEEEAAFLAPSLKRELIYRLLKGPSGSLFYQSIILDPQAHGIGRAIDWLTTNFKLPLKIEQLAKIASMSVSSLHHKFKTVALMGPLQYQKRLRLEEARRLLMGGLADATTAAFDVGYESPSQFIREYRRLFGLPPRRDVKSMRSAGARVAGQ